MYFGDDYFKLQYEVSDHKCQKLTQKIKELEQELKTIKDTNERYLTYAFQFLHLILKYQAKDINKKELFDKAKEYTRQDIYKSMYHKIVKKDHLGCTFNIDDELKNDTIKEDDTETLIITDLLSDNVSEDDTEDIKIDNKIIEDQILVDNPEKLISEINKA